MDNNRNSYDAFVSSIMFFIVMFHVVLHVAGFNNDNVVFGGWSIVIVTGTCVLYVRRMIRTSGDQEELMLAQNTPFDRVQWCGYIFILSLVWFVFSLCVAYYSIGVKRWIYEWISFWKYWIYTFVLASFVLAVMNFSGIRKSRVLAMLTYVGEVLRIMRVVQPIVDYFA